MRRIFASPFAVTLWVLAVAGTLGVVFLVGSEAVLGPENVVLGVVLTAVIVAVVWAVLARTRLWPTVGARLTPLWALVWGGCATLLLVFPSGMAWQAMMEHWGLTALAFSFGGAWPEETAKSLGVLLVLMAYPRVWDRPWHGLLLGTLVGLGFEMTENTLYAITGGYMHATSDLTGGLQMWVVRLVLGPGMHAMWSGIAGYFISVALREAAQPAGATVVPVAPSAVKSNGWRFGQILLGWLFAFTLHFAWNIQWPGAKGTYVQIVWPLIVYIPTVVIYVLLWRRALHAVKAEQPVLSAPPMSPTFGQPQPQQANEWAAPSRWTPPESAR